MFNLPLRDGYSLTMSDTKKDPMYDWLNILLPRALPWLIPGVLVPVGLMSGWTIHTLQQIRFHRVAKEFHGKIPPLPVESQREGAGSLAEIVGRLGLDTFKPLNIDGYVSTNLRATVDIAPMYLDTFPKLRGRVFPYPEPFHETVIPGFKGVALSGVLGMHAARRPRPTLLVVHGLLNSKHNDLVRIPMMKAFYQWGFNVCAIDLRMFGKTANFSSLPSSGGGLEARDLLEVIRYLKKFPNVTSVGVLGFSLGAGAALNAAGLAGEDVENLIDGGVLAVCPPLSFERTLDRLEHPPEEIDYLPIYHFFHLLMKRMLDSADVMRWVRKKLKENGGDPEIHNFTDFLKKLVAWGYIGVESGRQDTSTDHLFKLLLRITHPGRALSRVRVPTLMLAAKDDPLARLTDDDRAMLSRVSHDNSNLHFHETSHGGHCGYVVVARRWFYQTVRNYFSYWGKWEHRKMPLFPGGER